MDNLNLIRKTINEGTITRDDILNNEATRQYYDGILEELKIKNFPLLEVNTISKKTYMLEVRSGPKYYLVFDHYLLDTIHALNQIVLRGPGPEHIEAFFSKILAEECYINDKFSLSVQYAGRYLNYLETVIKNLTEDPKDDQPSNYLFFQQSFLIAHELFHFFLNQDPSKHAVGIRAKKHYLQSIYDNARAKDNDTSDALQKAINNDDLVEECLCDSTGIIQTLDVATQIEKQDVVEISLAAALAIMNQFTIASIQNGVKQSGKLFYDGVMNLFNTRLLHFKAYTSKYLEDFYSAHESRLFQKRVEPLYVLWLKTVQLPILEKMNHLNDELEADKSYDSCSGEEIKRIKTVLKQIFNT